MLYLIGLGLSDEKDISVKGLEALKRCEKIYLEAYTAKLNCSFSELEKFYGKKIILATREMVESVDIVEESKDKDVALLIIGDPLAATTHSELILEADKQNVKVEVIHNASVFSALGETGLQLYKFGKVISIPFDKVESPFLAFEENFKIGLHTLFLLDLDPIKEKYVSIGEALEYLLQMSKDKKLITEDTFVVGCARLGSKEVIKYGKVKDLLSFDFGKPMYCLIVPGKLHFKEQEMLERFNN